MENLGEFIRQSTGGIHVVFDEFQEITELNGLQIEGIMRSHIQTHGESYFFVGSRRRLLTDMFSQRNRPFFQSSIMIELDTLPHDELAGFISDSFWAKGKSCPGEVAEAISRRVSQHPYYSQKLLFHEFEMTHGTARLEDVWKSYERVLDEERHFFEATLQGLTLRQIALLKAIAGDPGLPVFSSAFLGKHRLSQGMVQKALPKLVRLDLIEKSEQNTWHIVDPLTSHGVGGQGMSHKPITVGFYSVVLMNAFG